MKKAKKLKLTKYIESLVDFKNPRTIIFHSLFITGIFVIFVAVLFSINIIVTNNQLQNEIETLNNQAEELSQTSTKLELCELKLQSSNEDLSNLSKELNLYKDGSECDRVRYSDTYHIEPISETKKNGYAKSLVIYNSSDYKVAQIDFGSEQFIFYTVITPNIDVYEKHILVSISPYPTGCTDPDNNNSCANFMDKVFSYYFEVGGIWLVNIETGETEHILKVPKDFSDEIVYFSNVNFVSKGNIIYSIENKSKTKVKTYIYNFATKNIFEF